MSGRRKHLLEAVAPPLVHVYIRLLHATMRWEYRNRQAQERARREGGQYILAFWHSRFLLMPYGYPDRRCVVLLSRHRDARMLARVIAGFHLEAAYGSSTAGGAAGLREILRRVRDGYDVAVAPDGPRGPRRRAKAGVVAMAKLTGLPVLPIAYSAGRARRLVSWDRTLVPRLFSRGLFVYGEPLRVRRDADRDEQESTRRRIERELDRLTDLADRETGLGPEEP
jgi:lysophospholipid acyltransferase (LPLAT)-like uncharacterized protein